MSYRCPVCGYLGLSEPPYDDGLASFEICVSCGTQFGYDDVSLTHEALREKWIEGGCSWWFTEVPPPDGWDPVQQLTALGSNSGNSGDTILN
jgi:hypothetical protein